MTDKILITNAGPRVEIYRVKGEAVSRNAGAGNAHMYDACALSLVRAYRARGYDLTVTAYYSDRLGQYILIAGDEYCAPKWMQGHVEGALELGRAAADRAGDGARAYNDYDGLWAHISADMWQPMPSRPGVAGVKVRA